VNETQVSKTVFSHLNYDYNNNFKDIKTRNTYIMAEYKQAWIGLCLGKATKGYETTNLKNWQFVFTDVY